MRKAVDEIQRKRIRAQFAAALRAERRFLRDQFAAVLRAEAAHSQGKQDGDS